ncbi:LysR substrate-binding domain-containing protein [Mycolicibacterium sp.]|uniref:LysR substrate-binding domain-containing protein n=1 Tax=Mycolicibacterium sp. TaxID=2320850 RepID=UPI003453624D
MANFPASSSSDPSCRRASWTSANLGRVPPKHPRRIRLRQRNKVEWNGRLSESIAAGTPDLALGLCTGFLSGPSHHAIALRGAASLCCRHDHRLAQRDHVTVTALAEEDLIGWPAEFGLQRLVEDAFAARHPRILRTGGLHLRRQPGEGGTGQRVHA